jgi:hypothetical protein
MRVVQTMCYNVSSHLVLYLFRLASFNYNSSINCHDSRRMENYNYGQPSQAPGDYVPCTYTEGIDLTEIDDEGNMNFAFTKSMNMEDSQHSTPTATDPKLKKATTRRLGNYTQAEDEILVSAYMIVSKDPAIGTNQLGEAYWRHISDYYNEHKKTANARTQHSLEHRWSDIQRDTMKFCAAYDKVIRLKQSGKREDDKVYEFVSFSNMLVTM